jgi:hypothetical protein
MYMGLNNGDSLFQIFFSCAVALPMLFYNVFRSHGHLLLTCWRKAIGENVNSQPDPTKAPSPSPTLAEELLVLKLFLTLITADFCVPGNRNDWCFLCEFQTHVERTNQSLQAFSPISILSRLPNIGGNLGYGRQEDAHEFMRFVIRIEFMLFVYFSKLPLLNMNIVNSNGI